MSDVCKSSLARPVPGLDPSQFLVAGKCSSDVGSAAMKQRHTVLYAVQYTRERVLSNDRTIVGWFVGGAVDHDSIETARLPHSSRQDV
jgi:hypothetical protein